MKEKAKKNNSNQKPKKNMACRGKCDRFNKKGEAFENAGKYKGAYCSVCMKWLHFGGYGFKCMCCNQRLRLRNRGAQKQLAETEGMPMLKSNKYLIIQHTQNS